MMFQMIVNERGDEEVAVIIAPVHSQIDVVMHLLTRINQRLGIELTFKEVIRCTLAPAPSPWPVRQSHHRPQGQSLQRHL